MAKFQGEQVISAQDHGDSPLTRTGFAFVLVTYGMVPVEFVHAITRLQTPVNCQSTLLSYKGMEIGVARCRAITDLLALPIRNQPKYVLWLSDDELPPWDGLVRLWMEMERSWEPVNGIFKHGWDVLTSLVYLKTDPPTPVLWKHGMEGAMQAGRDYSPGDVIESDVADLGFGLMRLELFTRMTAPWFRTGYMETIHGDGISRSFLMNTEDCWFFQKCHDMGMRIGVHTGVRTGHLDAKSGRVY